MVDRPNISRREILQAGGLAAAAAALAACACRQTPGLPGPVTPTEPAASPGVSPPGASPTAPPTPGALSPTPSPEPTAQPEPDLLLHTLRRMYFGFTPAMLAHARQVGLEALLDEQFDPRALETRQLEKLVGRLDFADKTAGELFQEEQRGRVVGQFVLATLLRHVNSPRQINEMLVDFWSNHFNIFILDGFTRVLKVFDDRDAIRPNALGSFRSLLQASAHSPAMLVYLDQASSKQDAPNENYARELLELHTLGVDGGYTQEDVLETARLLTGWSVAGPRDQRASLEPGSFVFRNFVHDDGARTVLGIDIPASQGQAGGEALLDALAAHPSTARFISRKLAIHFVADNPPESIVDRLAQVFTGSGGDIPTLLRALVAAPEFAASQRQKFKRPLEYFVSLLIATEAEIRPDQRSLRRLVEMLRTSGQMPFFWPTPDGYPDQAAWWTTTSGMLNRWNFALQAAAGELPGVRIPLRKLAAGGQSPEDYVDLFSLQFLGEKLPDPARQALISVAAEGRRDQTIPQVAGLILGSPYFQMR